jgi:hypothetical protein
MTRINLSGMRIFLPVRPNAFIASPALRILLDGDKFHAYFLEQCLKKENGAMSRRSPREVKPNDDLTKEVWHEDSEKHSAGCCSHVATVAGKRVLCPE